ncbi:mitotic spindle checkpoint protein MAD1 [Citrus sinensis]|nr:mitotic spindle checkpoint protein MAD1 [Citrus sinensis]
MILRTPPPKRPRDAAGEPIIECPPTAGGSDRRLVIYEDPSPAGRESSHQPSDHLLCTYQCRQMVKSDFLDALTNAEKQVRDYQSKLEELNENFSKAEAERKKFRDQFLYAEQELAAAKGREGVLQEQLLKEVDDSRERLKKQIQLCSELEVKHRNELNLRRKAESAAASAEEKASLLEGKLTHLSDSIEREKKRLNNEVTQLKRESKSSISRIGADLEKMECRAQNAEKESEMLKNQMKDLKEQLNECLNQKSEVEKKLSSSTFQEFSTTDSNILVKHLQEEIRNYEAEVREARKLKASYENTELLKEKLLEEKSRRERVEQELAKLREVQQSMNQLEDELSSWKFLIRDIPGVSCSEDIPVKFAALQKEVIDSMMKLGEANAQLKQMEVALDAAQLGKQSAETEAALVKEKEEVSKSEVKRIESMLSVVTEERDKLRNVVNEFKKPKNDGGGDERANLTLTKFICRSLNHL